MIFFRPDDSAYLTNEGDHPLEIGWGGPPGTAPRHLVIPPGEERVVPMDAVINIAGDPRAGEQDQVIMVDGTPVHVESRASWRQRLRARYGCFDGDENTITNDPDAEHHPRPIPTIAVHIMGEDGQRTRITTVLEDPTGEQVDVGEYAAPGQDDLVQAVIRLQRQVNMQAEALKQAGANFDLPTQTIAATEADLPSDDPDTEPKPAVKSKPRKREQIKTPIGMPEIGVPVD